MSISLDEKLDDDIEDRVNEIHTSCPGRVMRYDPVLQQCDVQPLIRTRTYNETDQKVDKSRSIVCDVPVHFPGNDVFDVSWTVKQGDLVTLVYSEESLDDFLDTGAESGPYERQKHSASDAVAIPGLLDFGHPRARTPENGIALRVKSPTGPDTFKIELDLATMSMQFTVPNEMAFEAGTRISLVAEDIILNGRRVADGDEEIE